MREMDAVLRHHAEHARVQAQLPPLGCLRCWTLVPWLLLSLTHVCTSSTGRSARPRQQRLIRPVTLQARFL